jgi:hypothetical protein
VLFTATRNYPFGSPPRYAYVPFGIQSTASSGRCSERMFGAWRSSADRQFRTSKFRQKRQSETLHQMGRTSTLGRWSDQSGVGALGARLTPDRESETDRGVGGVPIEVSRFIQRHAGVFITLVPIVIVVLRVARVSNFETTTARGILESLGLVQVVAGTLLPLVPTALFATALALSVYAFRERTPLARASRPVAPLVALVCVVLLPWGNRRSPRRCDRCRCRDRMADCPTLFQAALRILQPELVPRGDCPTDCRATVRLRHDVASRRTNPPSRWSSHRRIRP